MFCYRLIQKLTVYDWLASTVDSGVITFIYTCTIPKRHAKLLTLIFTCALLYSKDMNYVNTQHQNGLLQM